MEPIHSYTYTSVSSEQDPLCGTFYTFQTAVVIDHLHANASRIMDLGIDEHELKVALASPITILAMDASGKIMGFASFKEKPIVCKESWIGNEHSRSTTELVSLYASAFCTVRGLRKPLATYARAIASSGNYKVVTIPEPLNVFFPCTKTDIMGSKVLYVVPSTAFFARIPMSMERVRVVAPIPTHVKNVEVSYAHLCGCEFEEKLFVVAPIMPLFPVQRKRERPFVPSLISGMLDDDECIIAELLNDMGLVVDIQNFGRARSQSFEGPVEMSGVPPFGVLVVPPKRMRAM